MRRVTGQSAEGGDRAGTGDVLLWATPALVSLLLGASACERSWHVQLRAVDTSTHAPVPSASAQFVGCSDPTWGLKRYTADAAGLLDLHGMGPGPKRAACQLHVAAPGYIPVTLPIAGVSFCETPAPCPGPVPDVALAPSAPGSVGVDPNAVPEGF
jgi:hypothetical protein